jgi:RND family efflux transporter MFP subunit
VVACVLGVAVWLGREPAVRFYAEHTTPPPDTAPVVKTGGAEVVLTASGYVNADAVVVVGTTVSGRLRALLVDRGDRVTKGQLIARLEDDELRAELGVQEASLARDRRTLARQQQLARSSATTQEQVDNAHSQVASDRASIDLIGARLQQTRIVSPIDGKVLERLVEPGNIVSPTTGGLLRLADLRRTVVEVDINEGDIGRLHGQQPAEVRLDAFPGRGYAAHVQELAQIADKAKATIQVKVLLEAPDDDVRPGMSAKVTFRPVPGAPVEPERLVVPARALIEGGQAVWVVAAGRVERREVQTRPLPAKGDRVEVVRGLSEGDTVITSGQDALRPGQKIAAKKD